MLNQLDLRLLTLTLEVNGVSKTYNTLEISASGTKYANALQNECEVKITNVDRATQDYILTQTSPYNLNRTPKTLTLAAGRQSYGTSVVYVGNIISSTVSQPPDITITLKCLTGNFLKGNILSRFYPGGAALSQIAGGIAQDTNTILNFQATNKTVANYNFTGAALQQVNLLNSLGGINAFIDNNTLFVKDAAISLRGTTKLVSAETGMIGIPEFTEQGIRVKFLYDNQTSIGGGLQIVSKIYPAANGHYIIYKLGFQLANRDTPFYWIADATRIK